jgi:hypothetical protein
MVERLKSENVVLATSLALARTAEDDLTKLHVSLSKALRNLCRIHAAEIDAAFGAAKDAQLAAIDDDHLELDQALTRFKSLAPQE